MDEKEKVLMTFVLYATFAKRDVKILKNEYEVDLYEFNSSSKLSLPFLFIKQFFFLLFNGRKYKAIVCQSAGYLSFLPTLFSKFNKVPVVIIAIGTDCAKLPEINYGSHNKTILSKFTQWSFKRSNLILPVHNSLEKSRYTYDMVKFIDQGIKTFVPGINTEIIEMVNGYDTAKWKLTNIDRKDNTFLSVTFAIDQVGYFRKGIDMIVLAAKMYPNFEFTIVGKVIMNHPCPKNITLIDNVSQEELLNIYNENKYYIQLSMFEGFPNALCEAMLCGCIPIGSDVAAIPDIIDKVGYILDSKTEDKLKELFDELPHHKIDPSVVRDRIKDNFSLERRTKEFLSHISNI